MLKEKKEIIKRALVLLAFADRCALEKSVIDGKKRSLVEREEQRIAIINWLSRMGYDESITKKEKSIFNSQILDKPNIEILSNQNYYECVEPLLWSLGLTENLSCYDDYVLFDFHPLLNLGKNHSLSSIERRSNLLPESIIQEKRELSMLWYWRSLENGKYISSNVNYLNAVKKVFGEDHARILKNSSEYDDQRGDFIVNNTSFKDLDDNTLKKIKIIAEKRFYTFEWLCTDSEWDEVNLVC